MIRVGFLGFGKTGQEAIYPFLTHNEVEVLWVIKKSSHLNGKYASEVLNTPGRKGLIYSIEQLNKEFLSSNPVDVVIDFSNSENVKYYKLFTQHNIKIVSAISAFNQEELKILDEASKYSAIIWSPNITMGVNLLIFAAEFIREITPDADVQIIESHFSTKKEKSGTALKIANKLNVDDSNIHSIRAGGILGKHEIIFGYPYQTIRLEHDTISRKAFGNGALTCAFWIKDKHPRLYNMEELLLDKSLKWYRKKMRPI